MKYNTEYRVVLGNATDVSGDVTRLLQQGWVLSGNAAATAHLSGTIVVVQPMIRITPAE